MLTITILGDEFFDQVTQTFSTVGDVVIDLEHSLISLSKWESKFEKPFLSPGKKSTDEILEYIKLMIITPNIPPELFLKFSSKNFSEIQEYIDSKQSATEFGTMPKSSGSNEKITSELIYYWMFSLSIPTECEVWHLNRLFSLIRIFNQKNTKGKRKMSHRELAARNRELNAQRRERLNSTG